MKQDENEQDYKKESTPVVDNKPNGKSRLKTANQILTLACLGLFNAVAASASAQNWTQTSAPTNSWISVAASADGTTLVAASGQIVVGGFGSFLTPGPIYLSTNSGTDWNPATTPVTNWISVSCSGDGSIMVGAYLNANQNGGGIYFSTNHGSSWAPATVPINVPWAFALVSSSGNRMVAGSPSAPTTFFSTNSGTSWSSGFSPNWSPTSMTISADGSRLVAPLLYSDVQNGTGNMAVIKSPPASLTLNWYQVTNAPLAPYQAIASSVDGRKLLAGASTTSSSNAVYLSTNFGATWGTTIAQGYNYWDWSLACSARTAAY